MTQADDVASCASLPNSIEMVNCMRTSLGYAPVVPSEDTATAPSSGYGVVELAVIGGLLYMLFLRK